MDNHCSEDAIAHDVEQLKAIRRSSELMKIVRSAEDRFEVESVIYRLLELTNRESAEAA